MDHFKLPSHACVQLFHSLAEPGNEDFLNLSWRKSIYKGVFLTAFSCTVTRNSLKSVQHPQTVESVVN